MNKYINKVKTIPVAIAIIKYFNSDGTKEDRAKLKERFCHSMQDIVRSPCYGIALTVVHLAGVVLGAIAPNTLYETRKIAGELELDFLRITKNGELKRDLSDLDKVKTIYHHIYTKEPWLLSECFSPIGNLVDLEKYTKDKNPRKALKKFAKCQVEFRKENMLPCNDYGMRYPKNKPYKSFAIPKPPLAAVWTGL